MAIRIHELNHVAIHVRDLTASMDFYGRVLELPSLPRPDFPFGGAWYALGSQELHLVDDPELPDGERRHHHFALLVDDTYEAKRELEAKGLTTFLSHGLRPDGAVQLFFLDPDGYRIEFFTHPPENGK